MISRDRLAAVLADARDLPDGEEKYAELRRIAAHADSGGHQRIGFAARIALLEAYRAGGQGRRAHESLLWCLWLAERQPGVARTRRTGGGCAGCTAPASPTVLAQHAASGSRRPRSCWRGCDAGCAAPTANRR